jgi:hypothetical protein
VPKESQHQFDYLFSLSKEVEYVELVKQAGDVLVGAPHVICCPGPYVDSNCRKSLMQ